MNTGQSLRVDDPDDRLIALRSGLAIARHKISEALQALADEHQISRCNVTYAMDSYADNLLACVVNNVEHEIARQTEP